MSAFGESPSFEKPQLDPEQVKEQKRCTEERVRLIHPNRGSEIDVEKYSLSFKSRVIQFGLTEDFSLKVYSLVTFRPQRLVINAPARGLVYVKRILVANVSATVGTATAPLSPTDEDVKAWEKGVPFRIAPPPEEEECWEDAFNYADPQNDLLDLPAVTPYNALTLDLAVTDFCPPGYTASQPFRLTASFHGYATIV